MENITDIKILQLVKELDAAVASGDVRRADDVTDILFRLRRGRDGDAVMPEQFAEGIREDARMRHLTGGHTVKKRSIRKIAVIAAAVTLTAALGVTALATQFFGLRDLVIQESAPPSASVPPEEADPGMAPSESSGAPAAPAPHDMIAHQGYPDSPEYQAAAAWKTFCDGYDTDNAVLNQVGNSANEYTEQFPMYLVYSKEMADALTEITAEYGLTLHTSISIADNADALYGLAGTGRFLDGADGGSTTQLGGYIYDDGTFHYDGTALLQSGAVIHYQLGNYIKGTFSDTLLNVGDADDYREWSYQTACGVTVSLALGGGKAIVIADLPDSFVTVNVLAGTSEGMFDGSSAIDDTTLEAFADTIDFSEITR